MRGRIHWPAAITLTLVALPFLLGAAYTGYRSLWFQYAAERSSGTVIDATADGFLTVEYLTGDEKLFSTRTGGSDYYKGYATGDKLTVFYDPKDPEDARVDLWLEHWIVPLMLLVPGAVIMLATVLISSHLGSSPRPRWLEEELKRGRGLPPRQKPKKSSPITKL